MLRSASVDVGAVRDTVTAAFDWSASGGDGDLVGLYDELRGHVQQLVPAVLDLAPRMRGMARTAAVQCLTRGQQLVEVTGEQTTPTAKSFLVRDFATTSKLLLDLYERPGPLGRPVERDEIAEVMTRRQCGACGQPIGDGEAFHRAALPSNSGPPLYGYVHRDSCPVVASLRRARLHAVPEPAG